MQFRTMFRVNKISNEYGGLGGVVGYFTSQEQANTAAKGKGWWGSDGQVTEVAVVSVDGELYELASTIPIVPDVDIDEALAARRAKALAKLTPEERRILGLEKP